MNKTHQNSLCLHPDGPGVGVDEGDEVVVEEAVDVVVVDGGVVVGGDEGGGDCSQQ